MLTTSTAISLSSDDFLRIGGDNLDIRCVPLRILPHRVADFSGDAPDKYGIDVVNVCLGLLGLSLSNVILTVIPRPESPEALRASAFNRIENIWETFDRERKHYLATDDFPGEDWGMT